MAPFTSNASGLSFCVVFWAISPPIDFKRVCRTGASSFSQGLGAASISLRMASSLTAPVCPGSSFSHGGCPASGQEPSGSGRMAGHERGLVFSQHEDSGLSLGRCFRARYRASLTHYCVVTGQALACPLPSTMHSTSRILYSIPLGGNRRRFERAGLRKRPAVGLLLVSVRRHISMS